MILYKVDLLKLYEGRDSKTFFVKLFSFVILFFGIPVLLKCSSSYQYIRFPSSLFLYWTKFPQQDKKNYILFFLVYIYIWRSFLSKSVPFFQISSVFSVERFDRSRQYFMKSTAWAIKSTKRLVRWNMRFTSEAFCLRESHQMLLLRCRFWISYLDLGIKRLYSYNFLKQLNTKRLMYMFLY